MTPPLDAVVAPVGSAQSSLSPDHLLGEIMLSFIGVFLTVWHHYCSIVMTDGGESASDLQVKKNGFPGSRHYHGQPNNGIITVSLSGRV